MDAAKLQAMEQVLDQENQTSSSRLTGQAPASEAMQANPAFKVWQTSCCSQEMEVCD